MIHNSHCSRSSVQKKKKHVPKKKKENPKIDWGVRFPKIDEAVHASATPCGGLIRPHPRFTLLLHFAHGDSVQVDVVFDPKPVVNDVLAVNGS